MVTKWLPWLPGMFADIWKNAILRVKLASQCKFIAGQGLITIGSFFFYIHQVFTVKIKNSGGHYEGCHGNSIYFDKNYGFLEFYIISKSYPKLHMLVGHHLAKI